MGTKQAAHFTAPPAMLLLQQEDPVGSQRATSASPSQVAGAVPASSKPCRAAGFDLMAWRDLSAVSFEDRAEFQGVRGTVQ